MLLLVTILLVAVGTISLIFGFVQSSLLPIYISIACSVLAAVVLLIFSRMTAKSQQVETAGGPTPLDTGGPAQRDDRTAPAPAFSGTGLIEGSSSGETFAAPDDRYGSSSRFGAADDEQDEPDGVRPADTDVVDDDFPIERYDSRRVGEILPLLAELDLDELDIVREHEEQGKSRATVLARIDQLIDQLEAEDRQEAASRFDEPVGAPAFSPAAGRAEPAGIDEDDDLDEAPVPVAAAPPPPPPPTQAVTVAALPEDDGYFPIEDYDELRPSEILPLLPELDDDELVMVRERERSTAARSSILRRIDALLLDAPESGAAPPEPEPVAAFAPEPAPVDAAPKKVPSRRAPAAKKTAAAAKAPAKRAPVAVPAKKAPVVKKAAARKSTVSRDIPAAGPVRKAPVKAGKTAVAKKAPSEKVASGRAAAASKGGGTASAKAAAAKATKAVKARKTTKG